MNSQIGNMLALRSYDSLVSRKTLWSVLVFLVVMAHLAGITGNHDDLSVLRASSYMSRFPNDPLLTQLEDHLENRALQLDPATYTRYYVRLKVVNSYVAQNWLVGVLESLPSYSAYQSVFLSNLILHLLAAIAVFLVFGRFWGTESNILMYSFLLSLIPASLFPVGRLMLLFPFQAEVVSWFIPVSRGAALLFFFASLLVWHNVGRPFTLSWGRRVGLALLLSTAAILSHQGTALLLYVPTLVVTGLYRFSGYDPLRLSAKVGVRSFLLLLNSLSIVVAGMKLTLLATLGGFENVASSGVNILLWAIEANLLTYYWLRMRLAAKGDSEDRLRLIGDTLARYLVPFSAFVLGFNLVQPSVLT